MKKSLKIGLGITLIAIIGMVLSGIFILADLRTSEIKNDTQSKEHIALAQHLLDEAVKKQGFDKMNEFSVYEAIATDHWKGAMGEMANPWSWNNNKMAIRYSIGDFDGQVEVLEGEKKGFTAGIQSWDYYEKRGNAFQSDIDDDHGIIFTLAAYHYFFELAQRLSNAPFIRYAGKDKLNGKDIEKVFVSWGNETTKEYDHYILWIGKESSLIEAVAFTTRDNPMPAPAFMYGSLRFDDYRDVNGIMIPFVQTAQMGDPKDDINEFIHQFNIQTFEWDNFELSQIRPLSGIAPMGDEKR